jgi:hypothetical protein
MQKVYLSKKKYHFKDLSSLILLYKMELFIYVETQKYI